MYKIKENFTEIVFGLALFCVFVSKSLFNVFWIILALIGFSRFFKKKQIYKEKIFYCVHPNSFWWHKTMKKYGNKKGKEIFKSILNNESKN